MGVKVTGVDEFKYTLRNFADRSSKGSRETLKQGAIDISELAKLQAPVDKFNLEASIKVRQTKDSLFRNRAAFEVYIDDNTSAGDGRTVGEYAENVHENYDRMTPGKGTIDKRVANPGVDIGGKFLERAFETLTDEIKARVEARVNQGVGH